MLSKTEERSAMSHNVSSDNEAQRQKNKSDGPVILGIWYYSATASQNLWLN